MTSDILPVRLYSRKQTSSSGQQEYGGSHAPLGRDKTRSDGKSARRMHLPGDVPGHRMPARNAKHNADEPCDERFGQPDRKDSPAPCTQGTQNRRFPSPLGANSITDEEHRGCSHHENIKSFKSGGIFASMFTKGQCSEHRDHWA